MSLQFVFIFFVLAVQSVSSDSFEPFKKDQEEEIKNDLEEDGKESDYDPSLYGGYASPKLYYEKMLTLNAEGGNMKKVKLFLDAGIDVNAQEEEGDSALMRAASAGRRKTVKLLLKRGADPSLKNKVGNTALMMASAGGYKRTTQQLLKHNKTEVNVQNQKGETALYMAAANKKKMSGAVTAALLKAGEDPDTPTTKGWTPLHAAVDTDQPDVVEELLKYDADVNYRWLEKNNCTALMISLELSLTHITHLLLFGGGPAIEIDAADDHGVTTLMYACVKGNLTVVQEMLRLGADVNAKSGWDKDTALHRASFFSHLEVARALLKRGARVTAQNYQLVTPLMKASWYSNPDVVSLLLKFGAGSAMEHESIHGDTALGKARLWRRMGVVAVLEEEEKKRKASRQHYEL